MSNRTLSTFATFAVVSCLLGTVGCSIKRIRIASPPAPTVNPGLYTQENFDTDNDNYNTVMTPGAQFDLSAAKQYRNNIAYGLMADIEVAYGAYYSYLFNGENSVAVGTDFLTLGLSAAASIATNPATKTIFSALGTGIAGAGLSVQKNYFAQQSFPVIGVAMQTRRDKVRAAIISNLSLDTTAYPLWAARRDLTAYFNAGTLPAGLQELQEEAGAAAAAIAANTGGTKPTAPTTLNASSGDSSVSLLWNASALASTYNLYYSTTTGVTPSNGTKVSGIVSNLTTQSGLTNGTQYYFVVTAVNAAGESGASNQASATPTAFAPIGAAPAAPTGVIAESGDSKVSILWQAPAGAQNHYVYYSKTSGVTTATGTKIGPITGLSTTVSALTNGTAYYFIVTASNASGEGPASGEVTSTPAAPVHSLEILKTTPH